MVKVFACFIFCVVSCCAFSQTMFDELVERIELADDPSGSMRRCRSFYHEQGVGGGIIVKTIFKAPDRYRAVTYYNELPVSVRLVCGRDIWNISLKKAGAELGVDVVKPSGREYDFALMQARLANPRLGMRDVFSDIAVSVREVDGVEYYKLTAMPLSGNLESVELYVDPVTLLKKAFVFTRRQSAGDTVVKMEVSSYHDVDGAKVPSVTIVESGESSQVLRLKRYKLNAEIDDDQFDIEKVVATLKRLYQ